MRLLLTRPAEESARSQKLFDAAGHSVQLAPMQVIEPLPATLAFDGIQALAVTSRQGARALARATDRRDISVYAVGAATAALLRTEGFATVVSAEGDAAELARLLAARLDPRRGGILHAAGAAVALDLDEALAPLGFQVVRTNLYQAAAVDTLDRTIQDALTDGQLDGVAFFSPRAATIFAKLLQQADLAACCSRLVAVCLSPAVAERVGGLDWRATLVADEPNLPALLAVLTAYGQRTNDGMETQA